MAKLKVAEAKSVASFAAHVEKLLNALMEAGRGERSGLWYRGVSRSEKYKLLPTLYRHPEKQGHFEALLQLEREMMDTFERHNVLHDFKHVAGGQEDELKLLFYMQHYGVPTRLLDWTSNPFIALYFALSGTRCDENGNYDEDAAVWALDPGAWNDKALSVRPESVGQALPVREASQNYAPVKVIQGRVDSKGLASFQDRPAAVLGIANSARVFAQRGVFTIFGRNLSPMEEQFEKGDFDRNTLTKIVIPKQHIKNMLDVLLRIGYTDSVSYPDLEGLAMEIKRSCGFKL